MKLVGLSGSLRRKSFNTALLRALAELAPDDVEIVVASIREIPFFDEDLEIAEGIPEPVLALKEMVVESDGLLLATPQYNSSVPGVLKNTIDWLTRPRADIPRVFGGLPVAVTGASPSPSGALLAEYAWLPVWRSVGAKPWFGGGLVVSRAHTVFDESGAIGDEDLRRRLAAFIAGFSDFVRGPT